jgi:hypothetical protein
VSFPVHFFFQAHLEKKRKKRKNQKEKKEKKENGRRGARPSELPVHRPGGIASYVHRRDSHGV